MLEEKNAEINRGNWKSSIFTHHLGQSANLSRGIFNYNGTKLAFIRSFDAENHLWYIPLNEDSFGPL
ncbi:MAG: hypothetical protein ACTSPI_01990, partial [Candidatus Heimdallarchaeaceae archaeon]